MIDEVILYYPGIGENGLNAARKRWTSRGFNVGYSTTESFRIADYLNAGLLKNAFTNSEVRRLEKLEKNYGLKIETSWQHMKLDDIAKKAVGKFSEAGITDKVKIEKSRSNERPPTQYRLFLLGDEPVMSISKRDWIIKYEIDSGVSKEAKKIQNIIVLFLEAMGIKEDS